MSSSFGKLLKVTIYGESHGPAVGVVLDGLPAGELIDEAQLLQFMARRKPGQNNCTTSRTEQDKPIFISGIFDNHTTGVPLCMQIRNCDAHSNDYDNLSNTPRPSHADYTSYCKWNGQSDMRGGGHFSGRLTAPICAAGGIALQILQKRGIAICAHLLSIGDVWDNSFPIYPTEQMFRSILSRAMPVISPENGDRMRDVVAAAAAQHDSVGGRIECAIIGVPTGLGSPMFEGLENKFAQSLFGIPGVKGVDFGAGFTSCEMRGSVYNDNFCCVDGNKVQTVTNHDGGIQGGISNGMPIVFRVAMKPTPSIGLPQQSVSLDEKQPVLIRIDGRHDPCIAYRAVPVVEAVAALTILDALLEDDCPRKGTKDE